MRPILTVGLVLATVGCASSPRTIELDVDSRLGSGATLWMSEIFSGFPLVSFHMTERFDVLPGASVHRVVACLPAHLGGLELTADNADGSEGRVLRYRIQVLPRPEAGSMPQDKRTGVPGIVYYEPPHPSEDSLQADKEVAQFKRAVAHAGDRKALGCWGSRIHDAMDRAEP